MGDVIDRPDVMALLVRQHWVAGLTQFDELGISRSAVDRAVRRGVLHRVHRNVVQIAELALDLEGRALAAQLAIGRSAFVSGPTAGSLHGLRGMPEDEVEITVHESERSRVGGCRVVATSWIDEERDVVSRADGIRVASPLRTLFGLARRFNQHRFERAAEDVWHKGLVTPDEAGDYLAAIRRSGKTGVKRMEHWLEQTSFRQRPAQSGLELAFVEMIERVGLPEPVRQHPLALPSGEVVHLDLAWPDVRLAVEPGHSWWHGGDLRQRADQARDRACALVGWHVHRYDEAAARDRATTARELLALYRRRVADLGGGSVWTSSR